MDEDEALRNYCREMICRVRSKQLPLQPCKLNRRRQTHRAAGGSDGTQRRVPAEIRDPPEANLSLSHGEHIYRHQCQGPVPPQLIAILRLKTFTEQMRRAAEVELHDPAVCSVCQQQQASLALKTFIRRKKTQLQFQTLKGRLNMPEIGHFGGSWCKISQSPPMPLTGFGRNYLVKICRSQQPEVALATTKERGVALATDEMRGYPDKKATGTHLARPRCPFSDR